jgi:colicin import membrane protein
MLNTAITPAIRDRVVAAANELYHANGSTDLPTVDAVRRLAQVSMNDCTHVMRQWRKLQTNAAEPVSVVVPELIAQASGAATEQLWKTAMEHANESLDAAKLGWEHERAKDSKEHQDIVRACDEEIRLNAELQARLVEVETRTAAAAASDIAEIATLRDANTTLTEEARSANARTVEIEKRADDLKSALTDAQSSIRMMAAGLETERRQQVAVREQMEARSVELESIRARYEIEQRLQVGQADRLLRLEADLAKAAGAEAHAREEAARLKGMCDGLMRDGPNGPNDDRAQAEIAGPDERKGAGG